MKIKEGYILKEVAGNFIVVAIGEAALDFNGVITLNETGAFLWDKMSDDITEQSLVDIMMNEYEIDENTAKADVLVFTQKLKEAELLV